MKRLLMGTAALVALGVAPAGAQQPVKIGFVSTFSGPTAVIGNDMRNSFELARRPAEARSRRAEVPEVG